MKIYFTKTPHQDYVIRLKQSIRAQGDEAYDLESDQLPNDINDIVVVWGLVNAKRWQARGCNNVLIFERGYLGNRIDWLSIGWDDLNGKANFYNQYVSEDKWRKYWKNNMSEWTTNTNGSVLITGQVLHDQSISDCVNYNEWLNDTIVTLQNAGHDVIFRPHPLETNYKVEGVNISNFTDFLQDLRRSKCLVTWSSTSSIVAAYHGVPTVTFSDYAMTKEISSHSLDILDFKPDRNNWGRKISYCQWNTEELTNGEAWYHIKTRFYY